MMEFEIRVDLATGAVRWVGVETGKTEMVARSGKDHGFVALNIGGHSCWVNTHDVYDPAHYAIYRFRSGGTLPEGDKGTEALWLLSLFGLMQWPVRRRARDTLRKEDA